MLLYEQILIFVSVTFLLLAILGIFASRNNPLEKRIEQIKKRDVSHYSRAKKRSYLYEAKKKNVVGSLGSQVIPQSIKTMSNAKKMLAQAGFYSKTAIYNYYGTKVLMTLFFISLVLISSFFTYIPLNNLILGIYISGGIGFFLPNLFLHLRKKTRHQEFFRRIPDMLDLIVVCLDAGLGLDAAMRKISNEFSITCKILAQELQITCNSMRLGQPRREALNELAERTGSSDLKTFTTVILQAEKYGTSITNALRVHADDLRTKRRQYAEETAAKTAVKLIFPLAIFIFPAIFIVTAGPAVIRIFQEFGK